MAVTLPGIVVWQTTSWKHYNWNHFPETLNRDVENQFQLWIGLSKNSSYAYFPYIYGRTNVRYVINFERMEQQRAGVCANDPPRPVRRMLITDEGQLRR